MKNIANEFRPTLVVGPDMELSLNQSERNAYALRIKPEKSHDFLVNVVADLDVGLLDFLAQNSAAVNDGKAVRSDVSLPDFSHFQFNTRENPSLGVALTGLAQHLSVNNHIRFGGQFFDGQCSQNRSGTGFRRKEREQKNRQAEYSVHDREYNAGDSDGD